MDAESPRLDIRESNQPFYRQIVSDLERQILMGDLSPGAKLPSEAELEQMYDVSRTTVRKALDVLELNGLIYRAQGRGSFVNDEGFRGVIREIKSSRNWRLSKKEITPRTLSIKEIRCDDDLAAEAGFAVGDRLIEMRRLFTVNGAAAVYATHYLRPFVTSDRLRSEGDFFDFYKLLLKLGFEPLEVSVSISARILLPGESEVFNINRPEAALVIRQTYLAVNGQKAWFVRSLVLADEYEYHIQSRRV